MLADINQFKKLYAAKALCILYLQDHLFNFTQLHYNCYEIVLVQRKYTASFIKGSNLPNIHCISFHLFIH